MARVTLSCPVNPSEVPGKVLDAVLRIFPDADMRRTDSGYEGEAPGLDAFSKIIRRDRILDATRSVLLRNVRGNTTSMSLNKQVATVGKVSFADARPVLGAIEVVIEDDDIRALIDRVSPQTVDGEEVRP